MWLRDFTLAVEQPLSPCIMNVESPYEVGFGEGYVEGFLEMLRNILDKYKDAKWFAGTRPSFPFFVTLPVCPSHM